MAAAAKKNDYITPLVGKKRTTYRVRVRIQGKYVSKTFDTISKAKEFAATAKGDALQSKDITNNKQFKKTTMEVVINYYLKYGLDISPTKKYILQNIIEDIPTVSIDALTYSQEIQLFVNKKLDSDIPDQNETITKHKLYDGYMEIIDGKKVRKKYKPGTVRHYYFALKTALKFYYRAHKIPFDETPFKEVQPPPAWDNPKERTLNDGELELLRNACDELNFKKDQPQQRALLKAFLTFQSMSCCRVQEALLIKWEDIKFNEDKPEECNILIPKANQKNRRYSKSFDRHVPLRPGFFEFVKNELMPFKKNNEIYVFRKYWNQSTGISLKMKKLCKIAKITEPLTPHDFRHHSVSYYFLHTDLSQIEIAKITGHIELNVLKRYLNLRENDLGKKLWKGRTPNSSIL